VSDAGLVYLQDLKMLKVLNLDQHTKSLIKGLANLSELTALEKLNLADCKVTITGLEPLPTASARHWQRPTRAGRISVSYRNPAAKGISVRTPCQN
jgi:hypothetical protein